MTRNQWNALLLLTLVPLATTPVFNAEPAPEATATSLVGAAHAGAAADSITAVVARFDLPE